MHKSYLDEIRKFEGYTSVAKPDYTQHSNGYGTKARFPGEVIDRAEAERRFQAEISDAKASVERFAPDADEGTKAALTSLTYNAGAKWMHAGLGDAIRCGDMSKARELFLQYTHAGGQSLPGLVNRRNVEVCWFGAAGSVPSAGSGETAAADASAREGAGIQTAASLDGSRGGWTTTVSAGSGSIEYDSANSGTGTTDGRRTSVADALNALLAAAQLPLLPTVDVAALWRDESIEPGNVRT
jgi:lysozyme